MENPMPPEVENTAELLRVSTELQSAYFKRAEAVKKLRDAQRTVDTLETAIRALESERTELVETELGVAKS
jgi:hypothetical protein